MADETRIGPGPTGRWAELIAPKHLGPWWELHEASGGRCGTVWSERDARLLVYGSVFGGLDDEAAGRAWAKQAGKTPIRIGGRWRWDVPLTPLPDRPATLPPAMWGHCGGGFDTEAEAFAAVGAALRALTAVLHGGGEGESC